MIIDKLLKRIKEKAQFYQQPAPFLEHVIPKGGTIDARPNVYVAYLSHPILYKNKNADRAAEFWYIKVGINPSDSEHFDEMAAAVQSVSYWAQVIREGRDFHFPKLYRGLKLFAVRCTDASIEGKIGVQLKEVLQGALINKGFIVKGLD